MRTNRILLIALAWATFGALSASALKEIVFQPAQPPQKLDKSVALANDPAEPPLAVEVSYGNTANEQVLMLGGGRGRAVRAPAVRGAGAPAKGQAVKVASSARGTELTLETPGAYSGTANLSFKAAPPMRFTMKLTRVPNYDLQSLSITSGEVTLKVGAVKNTETTKYFDKKGEALETPTGAAYTVVTKRVENGQVDVQLRRGAAGKLGKAVSVSWQSDLNQGGMMWGGGGGFPGGGLIIEKN